MKRMPYFENAPLVGPYPLLCSTVGRLASFEAFELP